MGASWIRKEFGAVGVTQYPSGPRLAAVQQHLLGTALLCIDVSGSMSGQPLEAAIEGGLDFLQEAERAGYRCGLVLWHHGIAAYVPPSSTPARIARRLRGASAHGGNDLRPTLRAAIKELGRLPGDRVVCVFSDGDVGPHEAEVKQQAARTLLPDAENQAGSTVTDVSGLRQGIASMADALRMTR